MTDSTETVSRRAVLGAAGATILAPTVASMASDPASAEPVSIDAETTGVVTGVEFYDTHLYVRFEDPDAVDSAVLIDPNGQQRAETGLRLGETAAAFQLIPGGGYGNDAELYDPGTYTVYAYRSDGSDDEEVGTAEITLEEGNVEVVGFESHGGGNPRIAVRNAGDVPVVVKRVSLLSGVVYPDESGDGSAYGYRGYDPVDGELLNPGETDVLEYDEGGYGSPVRANSEDEALCGETRDVEVEIRTEYSGSFTSTVTVEYSDGVKSTGGMSESYYCSEVQGGELP